MFHLNVQVMFTFRLVIIYENLLKYILKYTSLMASVVIVTFWIVTFDDSDHKLTVYYEAFRLLFYKKYVRY